MDAETALKLRVGATIYIVNTVQSRDSRDVGFRATISVDTFRGLTYTASPGHLVSLTHAFGVNFHAFCIETVFASREAAGAYIFTKINEFVTSLPDWGPNIPELPVPKDDDN